MRTPLRLNCIRDTSPPAAAEADFTRKVGPHFPNVDGMTLVQYARGTCQMLRGGVVTRVVVQDLAEHLGTTMQAADQVMDAARVADCPNLHVGADGMAR